MVWSDEELRLTGCVYHYRGVICRSKLKCDTCGWNPVVEEKRKEEFRKSYWKERQYGMGST